VKVQLLKKSKFILGLLALILLAASCVPNKKITYLQYGDDLKEKSPLDTVMRTYPLQKTLYTLLPEDIISLRVASLTGEEYNFIKKYETDLGIIRKLNQYNQGENQGGSAGVMNQRMLGGGTAAGEGGMSSIMLDRMNSGFVLDLNGELELPQIGKVKLSGLTIPEAEAKVKEALDGYFETPMVRIQLLNFHFTILGEVESEGRYTSFSPETTIFDAISISGNLTEFADRTNIKIVRQEGGESKVIYLNLLDERTLAARNFYLKRDDLIIVPPLEARTTNRYTLPNVTRVLGIVSAALSLTALIISLSNR